MTARMHQADAQGDVANEQAAAPAEEGKAPADVSFRPADIIRYFYLVAESDLFSAEKEFEFLDDVVREILRICERYKIEANGTQHEIFLKALEENDAS